MNKTLARLLAVAMCVVMTLTAAPLGGFVGLDLPSLFNFKAEAESYSGTCGDNITWSFDTGSGLLEITGTGAMTDWSYYSSAPWYSYYDSIKTVNVSSGVTSIGDYAFYGCTSLINVIIPNGVTSIGISAFRGCNTLASATIPDSVTSIGNLAFCGCKSLTSVMIPDGVTNIGSSAFYGCKSLTSVMIPDGVTNIGSSAFEDCSSLASVTIPDSVTSISSYAFDGCTALKDVYYTGAISRWLNISFSTSSANPLCNGAKLYFDGELVTDIVVPIGKKSIKKYAFYGYRSLTSITIPDSVTSIGKHTFGSCTSLASVTIPDSVTSIDSSAFDGCTALKDVYYTGDINSWLNISFGSSSANPLCNGAKLYFDGELVTDIVIPVGTESIENYVFYGCSGLFEITMPVSAKIYNSPNTFYNCTNIEKITLTKGNGTFQNYGKSAYYSSSSTYYKVTPWYLSRGKCTEVIVEDGVTGIGDYMFYDCAEIGDIVLPISVQSIGTNAFVGCQKLGKLKVYNRNCEFESNATGDYTTIVGYSGSTAEAYANANGFDFELIPEDDHEHIYSNSCDNECNICGYTDSDRGHSFDNCCDTDCNLCGYIRTDFLHTYSNGCDPDCDLCGYTRTELVHTYTSSCDPDCDLCGYIRSDLEHKDENADEKCDACEVYLSDIEVGVKQNVKVNAGETMLLKFITDQSGVYTFTSSSSSDTYGYIYDADKKQLASNDDSGEGNNFSITYTLKRGTVYYLGVKFYNPSLSGEALVTISLDQIICDHIKTHAEHMDPTCAQTGYDKVICDDCGDTVIEEIIDPLGHSEPVWKTVVKPTTSSEGTMNYVCPACDEVFDTKIVPAIALSGNSTAIVNFTTNTITGFDAGSTELEDYLSATNNGYVFTCSSDILCTGAVVELTDGETLINSYTIIIFGDIDGNGWYDANDAFIVNMIASGLISADRLSAAQFRAADCNHDGDVDDADFYLLNQASLMIEDIDQSATQAELATNAMYISYCSMIDQTAGEETNLVPTPDDNEAPSDNTADIEPSESAESSELETIFIKIIDFFKKIFSFLFSFIIN